MQLPGFCSEPVRASLEVTWWPSDDTFSLSSRLWIKDDETGSWRLEGMTAGPLHARHEIATKVVEWAEGHAAYLLSFADLDQEVKSRPW